MSEVTVNNEVSISIPTSIGLYLFDKVSRQKIVTKVQLENNDGLVDVGVRILDDCVMVDVGSKGTIMYHNEEGHQRIIEALLSCYIMNNALPVREATLSFYRPDGKQLDREYVFGYDTDGRYMRILKENIPDVRIPLPFV